MRRKWPKGQGTCVSACRGYTIPTIIADFAAAKPLVSRFGALLVQTEENGAEELSDFRQEICLENLTFGYEGAGSSSRAFLSGSRPESAIW